MTGEKGFLGYFLLRCKLASNDLPTDSMGFMIANIGARGLEFGILLAMGLYTGRRLARRA